MSAVSSTVSLPSVLLVHCSGLPLAAVVKVLDWLGGRSIASSAQPPESTASISTLLQAAQTDPRILIWTWLATGSSSDQRGHPEAARSTTAWTERPLYPRASLLRRSPRPQVAALLLTHDASVIDSETSTTRLRSSPESRTASRSAHPLASSFATRTSARTTTPRRTCTLARATPTGRISQSTVSRPAAEEDEARLERPSVRTSSLVLKASRR